ncbi:hypothetical protein D9M69_650270 [compost metagenome]
MLPSSVAVMISADVASLRASPSRLSATAKDAIRLNTGSAAAGKATDARSMAASAVLHDEMVMKSPMSNIQNKGVLRDGDDRRMTIPQLCCAAAPYALARSRFISLRMMKSEAPRISTAPSQR